MIQGPQHPCVCRVPSKLSCSSRCRPVNLPLEPQNLLSPKPLPSFLSAIMPRRSQDNRACWSVNFFFIISSLSFPCLAKFFIFYFFFFTFFFPLLCFLQMFRYLAPLLYYFKIYIFFGYLLIGSSFGSKEQNFTVVMYQENSNQL